MNDSNHSDVGGTQEFRDADSAVARITDIYERSANTIRAAFEAISGGGAFPADELARSCYPYLGIEIGVGKTSTDSRVAYGALADPGVYGTTLTRPDLFADYYRNQIELLLSNHGVPVTVGESKTPIALPFVVEDSTADITPKDMQTLQGGLPPAGPAHNR